MEKKTKRVDVNSLRYGDVTPADLEKYANELSCLSAMLTGMSAGMRASKATKFTVDGITKFQRGTALIQDFLRAVDVEATKAKYKK